MIIFIYGIIFLSFKEIIILLLDFNETCKYQKSNALNFVYTSM